MTRFRSKRRLSLVGVGLFLLVLAACGPKRPVMGIAEFPPVLPPKFGDIPVNGGRVISIAVHPTDSRQVVLSTQFGGLWKTTDGGARWVHLDGLPAVFSQDVVWAPNGRTLLATLSRDNRVENGGGIWRSNNGGGTWFQPASARPPAAPAVPARISGHGLSFAPDRAGRVYAGTDHGIAISDDTGATWRHVMLDAANPVPARSVLALPGDVVLALSSAGVHRSDDGGGSWTNIRAGDFSRGFKCLDVSPDNAGLVFVLQDVSTLLLYKPADGSFRSIPTPAGGSRGPFMRVSRANPRGSIALWVGAGVNLLYAKVNGSVSAIEGLRATDWQTLHRAQGLHDDSGHLGLDADFRPVLYGSDGGIFRPTNDEATLWQNAATGRNGWNSLQITDVGGTNVQVRPDLVAHSLYFSTQDNAVWASSDGGLSWPNNDCAEGFHIEAPKDAAPTDALQVAYGKVGCGPSSFMYSDAHLLNQRAAADVDAAGNAVTGFGNTFLMAPGAYLRTRVAPDGHFEVWVSDNNGASWRKRYDFAAGIEPRGVFQCSSSSRCYLPVKGSATTATGGERIGLLYFGVPLAGGVVNRTNASIRYLPDDGSLGIRATEFDWQSVFGVHPVNPQLLVAPDVANGVVRVSRDGGKSWTTDARLTAQVTKAGRLLLYDADAYHMQVTHISYDPYNTNRILLGTRDSGVIATDDGGANWRTVYRSEPLLYGTGFAFKRNETVIASSYGRGLWVIDLRFRPRDQAPVRECLSCRFLEPKDFTERAIPPKDLDSLVAFDGFVTGADMQGLRLDAVNLSEGARLARFVDESQPLLPIEVGGKDHSAGLRRLAPHLRPGEGVKGFLLEGDRLAAIIVGAEPFRRVGTEEPRDDPQGEEEAAPEPPRPYVAVLGPLNVSGLTVIGAGESLRILAAGFTPGVPVRLRLDGAPLPNTQVAVEPDGRLTHELKDDGSLPYGEHLIEVSQSGPAGEVKVSTRFLKAHVDHFERQGRQPQ